jgi:hypothetical protein
MNIRIADALSRSAGHREQSREKAADSATKKV